MEERNEAMEFVEVDETKDYNDTDIVDYSEDSDNSELDLGKVLKWVCLGAAAIGGIVYVNKDRIKEARAKRKEKKMRKYAEELGYDVVNSDDYVNANYTECDVDDEDCDTEEE